MTSVVDMTDGQAGPKNPFDGDRIEVSERELRAVAKPAVVLGRLKRRLNEFVMAVTYGR